MSRSSVCCSRSLFPPPFSRTTTPFSLPARSWLRLALAGAFLLLLGCHPRPPEVHLEPVLVTGSPALETFSGKTANQILAAAIDRRRKGDLEGARIRLELLLKRFPDAEARPMARYQLGLCYEREEAFNQALEQYTLLVEHFPKARPARDAWFRRALCLEYLGRHREALRSMRHIREGDLSDRDRWMLDVQRGISKVRAGRHRRGLRMLDAALDRAEEVDAPSYLRAKAHVVRAELLLGVAARRYDLQARREKRIVNELQERAELVLRAEREIAAATRLEEPEWILEGLLLLGNDYLHFQEALVSSPTPRRLEDEAARTYRQLLEERAQVLLLKAWRHYDEGIALAGRLQYTGRPVPALRQARDALKLEEIPVPQESSPGEAPEPEATPASPPPEPTPEEETPAEESP